MYKAIIVGYAVLWMLALTGYAAAQGPSCITTYVGGSAITTCR